MLRLVDQPWNSCCGEAPFAINACAGSHWDPRAVQLHAVGYPQKNTLKICTPRRKRLAPIQEPQNDSESRHLHFTTDYKKLVGDISRHDSQP